MQTALRFAFSAWSKRTLSLDPLAKISMMLHCIVYDEAPTFDFIEAEHSEHVKMLHLPGTEFGI